MRAEAQNKPTALITGGTSGVGRSIAHALVKRDYDVYFIGTDRGRGRFLERQWQQTGRGHIQFIPMDLSDPGAVEDFAADFVGRIAHLHVLANIAGILLPTRQTGPNGLEKTICVNHLAAWLLARRLHPVLRRTPGARIVNVGGAPRHVLRPMKRLDLNSEHGYHPVRAAMQAVHAKVVMTQVLAEAWQADGIAVRAFHPGMVRSRLGRHLPPLLRIPLSLLMPLLPAQSRAGIRATAGDYPPGRTGQFFVGRRIVSLDFPEDYRNEIWEQSKRLLAQAGIII